MNRLLKAKIIGKFGSIGAFCEQANFTYPTVRLTLQGKRVPKELELQGWCRVLEIPIEDAHLFFAERVASSKQEVSDE